MSTEPIRILLVEDDEDDYILTKDLLDQVENTKYEVEWVSSYSSALEHIHRDSYDIHFYDYRLGEHTGLELLREAVSAGCSVPIIILTGQDDSDVDNAAIKAGASDYLKKAEINSVLLERSIRYALERNNSEKRIIHLAYYDSLTDLPNRALFHDRLTKAMEYTKRYGGSGAVLFLDLDNFKNVNDTLEHRIGDLLLQEVAKRLNNDVRTSDTVARQIPNMIDNTVARLGGDEFTILLVQIQSINAAAKVAERILDILSQPFYLDGYKVYISASIGMSIYPADGDNLDTIIKNADTAMYHAKEQGRNNFQFYKQEMNASSLDRMNMENDLRQALSKEELEVHFQARINIANKAITGAEALIRWRHPEKGLIYPDSFINIAEESGLIVPMGEWVMNTACIQMLAWQTQGSIQANFPVAVNISSHQFLQSNLLKVIEKVLSDSKLPPQLLELEITESVIMKNAENAIDIMRKLKDMGVKLSMDDFGTGYSSFNYLKQFPLDILKIDRLFIKDITNSTRDAAIVKAIIAMAHTLDLLVVAEGVETNEQMNLLEEFGCDELQGFVVSTALSPKNFYEFMKDWETKRRMKTLIENQNLPK